MKLISIIFIFLFSAISLSAEVKNMALKTDSVHSKMYLQWKNVDERDSILNEISPQLIKHFSHIEYPETGDIKHLRSVDKLAKYTEADAPNFKFLFGDSLLFKDYRKRVSAIIFQGTPVQQECMDEITYITVDPGYRAHIAADFMPIFPGGYNAMIEYFNANVHFPDNAPKEDLKGEVILSFTVNKDGSTDKVKVLESCNDLLDSEAYRLVKSMPKWNAGIKRHTVPVFIMMQLIFIP